MYGLQENYENLWGMDDEKTVLQHLTALEVRERVGTEIYQKYFTFSFVRNPFDKVVSEYHWYLKYGPKCTFKDWVMTLPSRIQINKNIHILEIGHNLPQHLFLFDKEENIDGWIL